MTQHRVHRSEVAGIRWLDASNGAILSYSTGVVEGITPNKVSGFTMNDCTQREKDIPKSSSISSMLESLNKAQ